MISEITFVIMKRAIFLLTAVTIRNMKWISAEKLTGVIDKSTTNDASMSNRSFLRESSTRQHKELQFNASERRLDEDEVTFAARLMSDLSTGDLEPSDACLPFDTSCDSYTAPCCKGGCTSSNTCFCQRNNGLCFNAGKQDKFCCSNKCGSNGRCDCIGESESCSVGDGFCCDGLSCRDGKCVDSRSNDKALDLIDFLSR